MEAGCPDGATSDRAPSGVKTTGTPRPNGEGDTGLRSLTMIEIHGQTGEVALGGHPSEPAWGATAVDPSRGTSSGIQVLPLLVR